VLIAMAGLPGTGQSTLAQRLAQELGAVILGKDEVRAALFPQPVQDNSTDQADIAIRAIYEAAAYIRGKFPGTAVILDGRTFTRSGQLHNLLTLSQSLNELTRIIECVCADEVARRRLEQDLAQGLHPPGNRTHALYLQLQAAREPIQVPHLTVDTGRMGLEESVQQCLAYLSNP
jgi:predicted kinase